MGAITFSGTVLASGLDTSSIVSSLVSVAKIPMTQIQKTQSTLSSQSKKFSDIKTQLTTLQTAAKAL
ncbi:MAG: Flagellar hook-associated protein 2 N-terminus, partial [Myxococcaceae bacterium]|nr:Flagellar hook-associated protein 2 N-terminus [Myxococcaceae bacterium]